MKKTALITGASRGIGSSISDYFASQGYNLLLCAKDPSRLEKKQECLASQYPQLTIQSHAFDLANHQDLTAFLSALDNKAQPIDICIANAGILTPGLLALTLDEINHLFQVNVVSTIALCNAVAEKMRKEKKGRIVIIGSQAGNEIANGVGIYASTKAAINHYANNLLHTLLPYQVQVSCICPSLTKTDMTRGDNRFDHDELIDTADITATIDWLLKLSPSVVVPSTTLHSRSRLLFQ